MSEDELREMAEKNVEEAEEFKTHLIVYAIVNSALAAIWLLTAIRAGGAAWYPWFLFPLVFWGIGIIVHWREVNPTEKSASKREERIKKEMERIKASR